MVLLSVVNVWRGRVGLVVRGVRRAQVRMEGLISVGQIRMCLGLLMHELRSDEGRNCRGQSKEHERSCDLEQHREAERSTH